MDSRSSSFNNVVDLSSLCNTGIHLVEQAICAQQHCVASLPKAALALLGMNVGNFLQILLTFVYAVLAKQLQKPL